MPVSEPGAVPLPAGELGDERVRPGEDDEPDVEQRHVVEVAHDPQGVVGEGVELDRGEAHALEPRDQPGHHPHRQELRRRRPLEVGPVDREAERVERQRRGDRDRIGERLHPEVDGLLERVREVEVHVVRADHHVRADADQPGDADDVAGDERPLRVPRDQVVVDGHRREEQQVDDRMPEPPQHALRKHRIHRQPRPDRLHDHLDQEHRERDGRDDHVDRDHGQRDDRKRKRLLGRESPRPDVAEAEGAAEPIPERRLRAPRPGPMTVARMPKQ